MAYTVTAVAQKPVDVWGSLNVRPVTLQPAATDYATGGYAITAAACGLTVILWAFVISNNSPYLANWNQGTSSLVIYGTGPAVSGVLAQPAANTDLSAYAFELLVMGY